MTTTTPWKAVSVGHPNFEIQGVDCSHLVAEFVDESNAAMIVSAVNAWNDVDSLKKRVEELTSASAEKCQLVACPVCDHEWWLPADASEAWNAA